MNICKVQEEIPGLQPIRWKLCKFLKLLLMLETRSWRFYCQDLWKVTHMFMNKSGLWTWNAVEQNTTRSVWILHQQLDLKRKIYFSVAKYRNSKELWRNQFYALVFCEWKFHSDLYQSSRSEENWWLGALLGVDLQVGQFGVETYTVHPCHIWGYRQQNEEKEISFTCLHNNTGRQTVKTCPLIMMMLFVIMQWPLTITTYWQWYHFVCERESATRTDVLIFFLCFVRALHT